jgi:hypothetical protein
MMHCDKCNIQTCTYHGGEWCQNFFVDKNWKKTDIKILIKLFLHDLYFMAYTFVMVCCDKSTILDLMA